MEQERIVCEAVAVIQVRDGGLELESSSEDGGGFGMCGTGGVKQTC